MAKQIKATGYYRCKFCGKDYKILPIAVACEEKHDIVYVPLPRELLARLIQLMLTRDFSLIEDEKGQNLINILQKYKNYIIFESRKIE